MKRILSLFLCALLLCLAAGSALASSGDPDVTVEEITLDTPAEAAEDESVTEKDGWHFSAKGFLVGDNPGEEYILEDEKNGVWQYASADLAITITRYQETVKVKAASHITGGGFYENIPRSLPEGLTARIELNKLDTPPLFDRIARTGNIPARDMYNTFNMGIGMCLTVPATEADEAVRTLRACGENARVIGEVVKGEERVQLI